MKVQIYTLFMTCLIVFSCSGTRKLSSSKSSPTAPSNAFQFIEVSKDKTYGYTEGNPIKVGGVKNNEGPLNERRFLDVLAGPEGEILSYNRQGSCCPFPSENGFMGNGLLDIYEITWKGQDEPVILYINMYDYEPLKVPVGFTRR